MKKPALAAIVSAAAAAVLVAGCGSSTTTSTTTAAAAKTSASDSTSTESAAPTSTAPTGPVAGLVVESDVTSGGNSPHTVGVVDPATGRYTSHGTFSATDAAYTGLQSPRTIRIDRRYDPTLTLAATTNAVCRTCDRSVDRDTMAAGWIDRSGRFTSVTPEVRTAANDFDTTVTAFTIGFDRAGRFYFSIRSGKDLTVYRLPVGETATARREVVASSKSMSIGLDYHQDPVLETLPDGSLSAVPMKGCIAPVLGRDFWIGQNAWGEIMGDQVVRYPVEGTGTAANCLGGEANRKAITPKIEFGHYGSGVKAAISNPAGTQVIFKVESGACTLYTVAGDGSSQPKELSIPGKKACDLTWVDWR